MNFFIKKVFKEILSIYNIYYRMLSLKLNKSCDSIFDNIEFIETIDVSILDKLIQSDLLQITSWKAGSMTFENEKQQLQLLRKNIKNNKLKVVYKKAKYGYGRVYPQKSLSLCSLRRQIRHTLSFHQYVDIDVVNCHPELLLQICDHNNIKTKYLKKYVENRDEILVEVQREYNCERDIAKKLFIILAYYGSFNSWVSDNNIEKKEPSDFIQDYINELKCIGLQIVQANPELLKAVKDAEKKNEKASVVSIFLQEKERQVLEVIYEYLKNIVDRECVLCFDGIMILKSKYNPDLLEELSQVVLSRSGFKLKFIEKEMNDHYLNQLPADSLDEFEIQAKEFELTHCKIINKSIYIKQTETDIIAFSKGKLRDSYEHLTCGEDKKGKPKLFIDLWITGNKNIRSYDDMNTYPYPLICPSNMFNLWTPFKCEQYTDSYKPNKEGLNIILNHIKILCGNDDIVSDYFIKWIGQMIQYPATKTICPTLISKEGAGKGTFIKLMVKLLGKKKVLETTTPSRDVWGEFNAQMVNSFFVNLNEISKKDTLDSQGQIKGLITDTSLTINPKGKERFEMNSYHRFIITTNKEDPIVTSQNDRRNLIIRSSDELINNKEYFENMNDILLEDINVIRTCYDYFKNIPDLDKFHKIPLPKTSYQENLRQLNLSPPEQFLIEFCSTHEGIVEVDNKDFFKQFNEFIEISNIEYKTTPLKFGVKIANLCIDGIEKGRHTKTADYKNIDINKVKKHFKIVDPFIEEVKVSELPFNKNCLLDFSD